MRRLGRLYKLKVSSFITRWWFVPGGNWCVKSKTKRHPGSALFEFLRQSNKDLCDWEARTPVGRDSPWISGDGNDSPQMPYRVGASADTMTPVYSTTAGLSQKTLIKLIGQALHNAEQTNVLTETVPDTIVKRYQLASFKTSVFNLHHPSPEVSIGSLQTRTHPAWRRIKFDELLAQQLSMRLHYRQRRSRGAPVLARKHEYAARFLEQLAFKLTPAQVRASEEISRDLAAPYPMQRLLQGDVGSGKTVVAALARYKRLRMDFAVLMAPTEILAEQHFRKLYAWFEPLGYESPGCREVRKKQKQITLEEIYRRGAISRGDSCVISRLCDLPQLGLAIIDEQHRFGVHQRLALRMKGARSDQLPHQLMMSATPIPRTLSMSYFADLDVSMIDQMLPGRSPR